MQSIIAAIRAALAALSRIVWRLVLVAGRLVHMPFRQPPEPFSTPVAANTPAPFGDDHAALRRAAGIVAQRRPLPAKLVDEHQARWLETMDRAMLCKILAADDAARSRHLRRDPLQLPDGSGG